MAHTYGTKLWYAGINYGFTCAAGTTLMVIGIVVAGTTARVGGAPTYGLVALVKADIVRTAAAETNCELWYYLGPPTGVNQNIAVPNTNGVTQYIHVSTYLAESGYNSALDSATGAIGSTANPSLSRTPTVNGDVLVAIMGHGYKSIPTGRTGVTLYEVDEGAYTDNSQYRLVADTSATAVGWTQVADNWCMVLAAFKQVSAPPAAPTGAYTDSKTQDQIVMRWTDNSSNETGFKMYKDDVYLETVAAGSVSYTFTGLTASTVYDLAVKATNADGDSAEAQLTETTLSNSLLLLNVGDVMKQTDLTFSRINVGDVWRRVIGIFINIGDVWKDIIAYAGRGYALGGILDSTGTATLTSIGFLIGPEVPYDVADTLASANGQNSISSCPASSTVAYLLAQTNTKKFIFATEVDAAVTDYQDTNKGYACGVTYGDTEGYILGGKYSTTLWYAIIDNILYSTEVINALAAVLSVARRGAGSLWSASKGYAFGGELTATTESSVIDALVFVTETCGAIAAVLSPGVQASSAVLYGTTGGYICGGGVYGTGYKTTIQKFLFATEVRSAISAVLSLWNSNMETWWGTSLGYIAGGWGNGTKPHTIQRFNFSTETCINITATLSDGRQDASCASCA